MVKNNVKFIAFCAMYLVANFAIASSLAIQVPAVYEENVQVREAIKECVSIENVVPTFVFNLIQAERPDTKKLADVVEHSGRVMKLTIMDIVAVGGGSWSGAKTVSVRADIFQDGRIIKSAIKTRGGRGGLAGPMNGTCAIVQKVSEVVAGDIAKWYLKFEKDLSLPLDNVVGAPAAVDSLHVLKSVRIDQGVEVRKAILEECNINSMVSSRVLQQVWDHFPDVRIVDEQAKGYSGKLLALIITEVEAEAGGSLSGQKELKVRAELFQEGKLFSKTEVSSTAGSLGVFGPIRGTCDFLSSMSTDIGKKVAKWLENPQPIDVPVKSLISAAE